MLQTVLCCTGIRTFTITKDGKESWWAAVQRDFSADSTCRCQCSGGANPDGSTSTKVTHGIAGRREVVLTILYEMQLRPEKGTRNSKLLSDYTGPERPER